MFTFLIQKQSRILLELLQLYYPAGAKIIDLTFGKGRLWADVFASPTLRAMYPVTACDASPAPDAEGGVTAVKRNLFSDTYDDLGLHDVAVYDPPYLVQRVSFDYANVSSRSWGASDLEKFTTNSSVEVFNYRVECVREKARTFLKPGGQLLVKILDPRKDTKLICHHLSVANILMTDFELVDIAVYERIGPSTNNIRGHLHNLHGYWLAFQLKESGESKQ